MLLCMILPGCDLLKSSLKATLLLQIFCLHGGLSPTLDTLDHIRVLDRIQEVSSFQLAEWYTVVQDDWAYGIRLILHVGALSFPHMALRPWPIADNNCHWLSSSWKKNLVESSADCWHQLQFPPEISPLQAAVVFDGLPYNIPERYTLISYHL